MSKKACAEQFSCVQASGEAVYTSDVSVGGSELFAAIVPSTQALAHIVSIDPNPALELPGVVTFVGPDDIPAGGRNTYSSGSDFNTVSRAICQAVSFLVLRLYSAGLGLRVLQLAYCQPLVTLPAELPCHKLGSGQHILDVCTGLCSLR